MARVPVSGVVRTIPKYNDRVACKTDLTMIGIVTAADEPVLHTTRIRVFVRWEVPWLKDVPPVCEDASNLVVLSSQAV